MLRKGRALRGAALLVGRNMPTGLDNDEGLSVEAREKLRLDSMNHSGSIGSINKIAAF